MQKGLQSEDRGTWRRRPAGDGRCAPCRIRLGCLACLLCLAGCTGPAEYIRNGFKVGPNYHRPEAAIADDWIDTDARVRRDHEDDSRWWTVLGDPAINHLVCEAYRQNLTLREAGFRVLQARAERAIAIGNIFPQEQVLASGFERHVRTGNIQGLGRQRWYQFWAGGFALAWEIDVWGEFRRAVESASATLDASVEDYDAVLVTLLADVASTYVEMRTLQARIELTRLNVKLQQGTLEIAEIRFKDGATTELDVQQAKENLAETEATIPPLEISLRQVNNRLCVLLGLPSRNLIEELGPAPIPTVPTDVAVGIPGELLRRRPDVRRAERLAAAQSAQIGIAVSDLYPQVTINGEYGVIASRLGHLFEPRSQQGFIGPSFVWNILNYGRLLNNVRAQDAEFQQLVAAFQQSVLQANQEVEDGLIAFLKSQEQVRYLQESVAAAKKSADLALFQYKEGKVDFNRVFLLENILVTQQDKLAQAQGNVVLGLIEVYRALGGGWQIRLDCGACSDPGAAAPVAPRPEPKQAEELLPAPKVIPPKPKEAKPEVEDKKAADRLPEPDAEAAPVRWLDMKDE